MTDTSSLHGYGFKEGHPCHGARCRSWTSDVSLFDLRCSREPTGGSYVGGSEFTRTLVTSGSADGLPVRRVWPIAPAGLTPALSVLMRPLRDAFSRCAMRIRCGELARSSAVWNAKDTPLRPPRRCTRFCADMAVSRSRRGALASHIGGSRSPHRTCCGRWTSKVGWRWQMGCAATL